MIDRDFLAYDVALLLARHGEKRVLSELAKTLQMNQVQLEELLRKASLLKPKPKALKKRPDLTVAVAAISSKHPDKRKQLETLYARFLSKSFLPELKDVKRFLGRYGDVSKLKSRQDAALPVLERVSELSLNEISNLLSLPEQRGYSSLGVLSDEILKRTK